MVFAHTRLTSVTIWAARLTIQRPQFRGNEAGVKRASLFTC
jgi:hypothetical protein